MFYLFLLAHLVADFVLQPYWLVRRKRDWDGLLIHGGVVLACMLMLPIIDPAAPALWPAMLAITAIHVAADWWKVHRADRILRPAIVPFILDQVIHIATIGAVLSLALPAQRVWMVSGSPVAQPALYIGAYIIAAVATPIAVMVWLDPAFAHIALAGRARTRSLLISAAVISLTMVGGVLALPATFIGAVVVTRRPASPHPLDMPAGIVAVCVVATVLGVILAMIAR